MSKPLNIISFEVDVPLPEEQQEGDEVKTKKVKLDVRRPNLTDVELAQEACNLGFHKAMKSKAPLRIEVEELLKDRGIWNKNKQEKYDDLAKKLATALAKLKKGALKLREGRKTAIEIKNLRIEIATLNSDRRVLDNSTVEAQAETARFNYLVAACTVYTDTGKPFFADKHGQPDVRAYLEVADKEYAAKCAENFGILQYGLNPNYQKQLPENEFLIRFKMVNDDLDLVNSDGHLVDEEYRLVDKDNFLVDENGDRRDRNGNPIDKDGKLKIEELPFLDDETGEAVIGDVPKA